MKINDYDIDIVVQGFPGKSVCHGGLGWSSVVLLRAHDRIVLIDTGGFSMRAMLIKRFAERGLKPTDITDLLLTHSHHDHFVNWTMFPKARIVIGANELEWSLKEPWGLRARAQHLANGAQGRRWRRGVSWHHHASRTWPHAWLHGVRLACW